MRHLGMATIAWRGGNALRSKIAVSQYMSEPLDQRRPEYLAAFSKRPLACFLIKRAEAAVTASRIIRPDKRRK